jgi:hypothetical protein
MRTIGLMQAGAEGRWTQRRRKRRKRRKMCAEWW